MMHAEWSKAFCPTWRSPVLLGVLAATYLMIFSFSAQDATASAGLSGRIAALFADEASPAFPTTHLVIRKLAHAAEFALLYLIWYLLLRDAFPHAAMWVHLLLPLALVAVSATADEWSQRLSPGRSCSATDVLIDLAGASAMGLALLLLARITQKT